MKLNLQKVAKILDGELYGNPSLLINNIASFEDAKKGEIAILRYEKNISQLNECKATAVIVPKHFPNLSVNHIKVDDISVALAKLIPYFIRKKIIKSQISKNAYISKDAFLKENVTIYPFVYIGKKSIIGKNSIIYPFVFIGNDVCIGDNCILYPSVVVYDKTIIRNRVIIHSGAIIGADGFGYARENNTFKKIQHIGKVLIEDDVEIGANSCVDKATLGKTIIKKGTKIDNLVQIAHNCVIGEDCALAGMVGIAGSTIIGNRVLMGGQSGTAGHLTIGDDSIIGGQAGITHDILSNSQVMGTPAIDINQWKRINVILNQIPDLYKKIKLLENKIAKLINNKNSNITKN